MGLFLDHSRFLWALIWLTRLSNGHHSKSFASGYCSEGWTSILQPTEGFTLSCGKNAAFTSANQTLLGMGSQRLRDQALKSNCESFLWLDAWVLPSWLLLVLPTSSLPSSCSCFCLSFKPFTEASLGSPHCNCLVCPKRQNQGNISFRITLGSVALESLSAPPQPVGSS